MKRRCCFWGVMALAALVLISAAAFAWFLHFVDAPQGSPGSAPVFLTIEEGIGGREIARRLEHEGVIGPAWLTVQVVHWLGQQRALQPGEYRFDRPLTPRQVVETLRRHGSLALDVVLPPGLDRDEIAALLARAGVAAEKDLKAAFADPAAAQPFDPGARELEGYFAPGSYRFSRRLPGKRVAAVLVRRFQQEVVQKLGGRMKADPLGLRGVMTLASLVEKETARPEERARIAGVFLERLQKGMPLQCDPTVIYAARRSGRFDGTIHRVDLERDNPYNTYARKGLPPGPIAAPSLASIQAVLAPVRDGSLYFVAKGDGTHHFSATLAQHHAAVRKYLR